MDAHAQGIRRVMERLYASLDRDGVLGTENKGSSHFKPFRHRCPFSSPMACPRSPEALGEAGSCAEGDRTTNEIDPACVMKAAT
jgi:hypothetical protein